MKKIVSFFLIVQIGVAKAQMPDHTYKANIQSVKLHKYGDIYSYPFLTLNSNEQLELHFDDMQAGVKNYYYGFQLCNVDWIPANIQPFDYIRGFQSNRITTYRNSSIVQTKYTHYQAFLPERNSAPTRAGNYLLKVFLNDDTAKLIFTKRFVVVNNKATVSAQITQPFNANFFRTHQRVQVAVSTANTQINTFSPQDLKVVVVQNNIWSSASVIDRPTIFRGSYYEYSDEENTTFQAGKEWRWIDLRSLRLMSERMAGLIDSDTSSRIDVFIKADSERRQQLYVYYRDNNGIFTIENRDNANPYWQSDYAWTHFTFVPPANKAYEGKSVFLFGELTNYEQNDASKMNFNEEKGIYEKELWLKQGYYNYSYVTKTDQPASSSPELQRSKAGQRNNKQEVIQPSYENTEGNYWGTENGYMILVYYRPFGARADELIGFTRVNSVIQR